MSLTSSPILRLLARAAVGAIALLLLLPACAVAPRPLLTPPAPDRARAELAEARIRAAERPVSASRLRLGAALYHAGLDDEAIATLSELMALPGRHGAEAGLYLAAAAERRGDWSEARRGYARYLTHARDAEVRRRLRDAMRREAEAQLHWAMENELALDPVRLPARSVTVLPLQVADTDSALAPLGYGLADLIATDLARTGKLQVVERAHVGALLREVELGATAAFDSATAPRAGLLLGARHVVGGTLTMLPGERIRIDGSVSDVPSAQVIASLAAAATLESIFEAETQLVLRILASLGVTLTPAERRLLEQRPTKDLGAFLAYSRGVRDEAYGRYEHASAAFAAALARDPDFRLAQERLQGASGETAPATGPRPAALALMNRVNPSPASRLAETRDRQEEVRTLLEGTESAIVVIPIFIIPIP